MPSGSVLNYPHQPIQARTTASEMHPMSVKPRWSKPRAHLEFWRVIRSPNSWHLIGFVFDHAHLPDRQLIVTSDLVNMHRLACGSVELETVNTHYSLGRRGQHDLDADYRELLDEIIGAKEWQVARLEDFAEPSAAASTEGPRGNSGRSPTDG